MPELHLGDVVRMERMTPELIAQVAQLARSAVNSDTLAVAYFELGTGTLQQLEKAEVRAGYEAFGRLRNSIAQWESSEAVIEYDPSVAVDTVTAAAPDSTMVEPVKEASDEHRN
jgi:hypothetical protein